MPRALRESCGRGGDSGAACIWESIVCFDDAIAHSASWNMAFDEALLRKANAPVLRVYRWERVSVSFGCFEPYAAVAEHAAQLEIVRRWTGGGIVFHGRDVTYSLIVPSGFVNAACRPAVLYCELHRLLTRMLDEAGISSSLAESSTEEPGGFCFEKPVANDLMVAGRKAGGAAQRRTREGILQQGSLTGPGITPAMVLRLAACLADTVSEFQPEASIVELASQLSAEKYRSQAWTKRC